MNRRTFVRFAATVAALGFLEVGSQNSEPYEQSKGTRSPRTDAPARRDPAIATGGHTDETLRTRRPARCGGQRLDRRPPETVDEPAPGTSDGETPPSDGPERQIVQARVSEGDEVSSVVSAISPGETLVFPSGRFTWSEPALVLSDNWAICCQEDTLFEVPAGLGDGEKGYLLKTVSGSTVADNFHLENLTFDSQGRAAPELRLGVRNEASVDGIHYRMNGPTSDGGQANGVTGFVVNEDGRLRIDDYRQFNNGDLGGYGGGNSRIGIYVGNRNRGTIRLVNPVLQGFPNNACYVSRQPGTVVIENGLLMNNNVSAVRVSGGVEVRDTTVLIDIERYLDGEGVIDASQHNTRGFWGDTRDETAENGGLVSGCSVILNNYQRCTGLVSILQNREMHFQDCQFLLNADITAVRAGNGQIILQNSDFDGNSTRSTAGIGYITGEGNRVNRRIRPGTVPIESRNVSFRWSRTHPETPGSGLE